jgi:arsenate reductase
MSLKVYEYRGCGTCRKALKHLEARKAAYTTVPIREQPPTTQELKRMLAYYNGDIKRLFNTSGQDYRALRIKDKLASLSEEQAIRLLAGNGNLIKRPFILGPKGGMVGFRPDELDRLLD